MRLAGVYTGNGAQLLVDGALSVNVVNSFTNGSALGIAQDLISSTGHRSAVTVNGDVDISIKNQITDGTGQLGSFTPRSETIVGIRNGDGSGSSITVNGMADIDVEGTGIIADNKTDSSGFIAVRGGVVKAQKVAIGDDTFLNIMRWLLMRELFTRVWRKMKAVHGIPVHPVWKWKEIF